MDADPDHGGHKGVMFLGMDHHTVQAVVIQDAVVDPLRGSALAINLLISIRVAGNFGIKPDIPFRPGLNDSPVSGIRAVVFAFGTVVFPIGAAPHEVSTGMVITIGVSCGGFPVRHSCDARLERHVCGRRSHLRKP